MTSHTTGEIFHSLIGALLFGFFAALVYIVLRILPDSIISAVKKLSEGEKKRSAKTQGENEGNKKRKKIKPEEEIITFIGIIASALFYSVFSYVYLDGVFKLLPSAAFVFSELLFIKLLKLPEAWLSFLLSRVVILLVIPFKKMATLLYKLFKNFIFKRVKRLFSALFTKQSVHNKQKKI